MARNDDYTEASGGSKAKLIVMAVIGLCVVAIIGLAVNLMMRKPPETKVTVENPQSVLENLKRKARKLHRDKKFDEAIEVYDDLIAYADKLRKQEKYQGEGFFYLDDYASEAGSQRKQAEDDKLAASDGGVLADTREEWKKKVEEARKKKPAAVKMDAEYFAGMAREDLERALESEAEGMKHNNLGVKKEALQKARDSMQLFEKISSKFPEDAEKYQADRKKCTDLIAKLESELGEKKEN